MIPGARHVPLAEVLADPAALARHRPDRRGVPDRRARAPSGRGAARAPGSRHPSSRAASTRGDPPRRCGCERRCGRVEEQRALVLSRVTVRSPAGRGAGVGRARPHPARAAARAGRHPGVRQLRDGRLRGPLRGCGGCRARPPGAAHGRRRPARRHRTRPAAGRRRGRPHHDGIPRADGRDAIVPFEDTAGRPRRLARRDRGGARASRARRAHPAPGRGRPRRRRAAPRRRRPRTAASSAAAAAAGVADGGRSPGDPRVAVVSTGSELVPPGEPLERGQIPESNSELLAGLVAEAGCRGRAATHGPGRGRRSRATPWPRHPRSAPTSSSSPAA